MNERTAEATTTVEEDGVRVEKSFTDDAFPVPAVTFDLSSRREDAVRVRIVDRIPDEFPMDRVGFHPDYESENWTAYKDHRVEFERVLEPGESVETVFGIRDDDPDLDGFLGTPVIEHVPVGEEIGDVLGSGETDAVREVLAGDRDTLPGMEKEPLDEPPSEDEPAAEADTDGEATEPDEDADSDEPEVGGPEPRTVADGTTAAVTPREDAEDDEAAGEIDADEATEETDVDTDGDAHDEDGVSVAAALAEEIRSGAVEEDDMEVLRSELDLGVPRSVDVRISRLQSSVSDIEAYADALAEFIDEEGTAREVLDGLDARVDDVESTVDALDTRVEAGERAHGELVDEVDGMESDVSGLRDDVDGVETTLDEFEDTVSAVQATAAGLEETVEGVAGDVTSLEADLAGLDDALDDFDDDVETLYEEVDDAAAGVERADGRIDDVEERFGRFDEEFDDLWDDLAEVDSRLTDIEGRLGDDLEDVEAELEAIDDHLEELEAFRNRLNEAFGP
ncbi:MULTISPECIES: hypothetical protein [Haloferacaceae]|uniref:t-SNARE coiled-coil homology domain-containing protein n=1 Tax=Halorubrum glutamatedens TaxID=2707018 RepID=A0ABD5QWU8_9EURY|nr:hypothetical protein [Halobellus captivus]